jgi:hypothetical protein
MGHQYHPIANALTLDLRSRLTKAFAWRPLGPLASRDYETEPVAHAGGVPGVLCERGERLANAPVSLTPELTQMPAGHADFKTTHRFYLRVRDDMLNRGLKQ